MGGLDRNNTQEGNYMNNNFVWVGGLICPFYKFDCLKSNLLHNLNEKRISILHYFQLMIPQKSFFL